jgi:hypothetical protein
LVVEVADDGEDKGFVGGFLADVVESVMDGHVSLGHLVEPGVEGFSCFRGRGCTWGPKSITPWILAT